MTALTPEDAKTFTDRLKLFAQPQRLLILSHLLEGPCAVSALEAGTGIGQPVLSQQLGALRRAGIIRAERESRAIFYTFQNENETARTRTLLALLDPSATLHTPPILKPYPRRTSEDVGAAFAKVVPTAPSL